MEQRPTLQESADVVKVMKAEHRHILALFHLYLATEEDSRRPIVDQILDRLGEHFDWEERLFRDDSRVQDRGAPVIHRILLDHEEVKAMMHEMRHAESDDDESMDQFFEDMMQTVRVHFHAEERDLIPVLHAMTAAPSG